jgi:hypothetical protein
MSRLVWVSFESVASVAAAGFFSALVPADVFAAAVFAGVAFAGAFFAAVLFTEALDAFVAVLADGALDSTSASTAELGLLVDSVTSALFVSLVFAGVDEASLGFEPCDTAPSSGKSKRLKICDALSPICLVWLAMKAYKSSSISMLFITTSFLRGTIIDNTVKVRST